jgi:ectoine hydroxylase-related dioxygenase (phytanoyl-CoA dioxygenase family)
MASPTCRFTLQAGSEPDISYPDLIRDARLQPDAAQQLMSRGFVVLPGPEVAGGIEALQAAYDEAVATADPTDMRVSSSTRVTDFVNRTEEFDGVYVHPPVLAACRLVLERPFKLSNTCARTLNPGAANEKLHTDVKHAADGWPIVGYIWMVDSFDAENGATRFIPGSHLRRHGPEEQAPHVVDDPDDPVLACGPAGSLIIFNGSTWHGHSANRSPRGRRSVQGHFVARDARPAIDYNARMRPETLRRIGRLAKYLLELPTGV